MGIVLRGQNPADDDFAAARVYAGGNNSFAAAVAVAEVSANYYVATGLPGHYCGLCLGPRRRRQWKCWPGTEGLLEVTPTTVSRLGHRSMTLARRINPPPIQILVSRETRRSTTLGGYWLKSTQSGWHVPGRLDS